jgi:hypothetical protein
MAMNDVVEWLHQAMCALHGHDALLQFDRGRMFLKCVSCGHESPGWTVKEREVRPVTSSLHEAPRRRRFLPHLAGARRVA